MYYICVENQAITGVFNYEPGVPEAVSVTEITDEQYDAIVNTKSHYFDIPTLEVKAYTTEHISAEEAKKAQELTNAESRLILDSTDWKVLRHIRQKALGQPTTLSDQEYLELEQARADAADAIVQIQ
jgi:hypothetical protein